MRKKIVAGNWKMNKTFSEGLDLVKEIKEIAGNKASDNRSMILCPPFIHLHDVVESLKNNELISVGAQNCASEESGAFTGEVSVKMIKSVGAKYVIIGHSERRQYYNETDEILYKKVTLALSNGLIPIFCCGEKLPERNANKYFEVVTTQLKNGLFKLSADDFKNVIIAYEPVWAIGTGVNASPEQAQEMHAYIRNLIVENYNKEIADNTTILYGGSCNPANAKVLFANPDVDGGLIGGASLKANDFIGIYNSF